MGKYNTTKYLQKCILLFGSKINSHVIATNGCCKVSLNQMRHMSSLKLKNSLKFADISIRLASPDRLQPKPEVSQLQFGKQFTDHMLRIEYHSSAGGWQQPVIMPLEYISLHPAAKVLHYAVELFEGMKAFRGVDGRIRIFRPDLNMERMNLSAARSGLPQFDSEELIKCINRLISIDQEWVPHSESASLYIRPTLIGTEPTLGVSPSDSALLYTILCPVGSYFGPAFKPVSLLADPKYIRAWPGGCGDRKMGSNYAPTIHVQNITKQMGLNQNLWLYGEDRQITEAGTMNVFFIILNDNGEKEMVTPSLSGLILPGITRLSAIQLSQEWNEYKVTERIITMPEVLRLYKENRLLEVFGTGTACLVCPVNLIHYEGENIEIPTVTEDTNAVWYRTLNALTDIQYGRVKHPWARLIDE
ncbi:branched chain amino acid transaminase isoform X2 [Lycorma delicatula]|uniref:branched chain amino acid transaminase isoform X2 n=1 Tax=Lycorma delicatula TaxID=130591 RepID=UPI003F5191EC